MTTKLTKKAAEALWDELRQGFVNVEATLVKIIQTKAWEPLGYATFTEAWAAKLQGIRLATDECRAHVVYAMLSDGTDDVTIIRQSGVGDQAVARLRQQKADGVPPGCASVRSHTRRLPVQPYKVMVPLTHDELEAAKTACAQLGLDHTEEAAEAVRKHYLTLQRRAKRVARQVS